VTLNYATTARSIAIVIVVSFAGLAPIFPALAHIDTEMVQHYGAFIAGVSHPVLGPDHFLAMVSVGFVSAVLGGRHFWLVPACFVGTMPIGWLLGLVGVPFPPVEIGIAISVIALGVGGLFATRMPIGGVYAGVALFALLHGYAHGSETPSGDITQYAMGFICGTALLHLLGLFIGDMLHQPQGRNRPLQSVSLAVIAAGFYFLATSVIGFLFS
jgi:urease accessory protein